MSRFERESLALQQLERIEAEMRRIGYWRDNPPDLHAQIAAGELRFFLDAPSFELWLQCVFLPNARWAATERQLPATSQVGLMAMRQYDYHSSIVEAHELMRLLSRFDEIVECRGESKG